MAHGETYKNCMGSGSFNYSERVMQVPNVTISSPLLGDLLVIAIRSFESGGVP